MKILNKWNRKNVILTSMIMLASILSQNTLAGNKAEESFLYFQRKNLLAKDFGLTSKQIALTFDDGPGPTTVSLLKVLLANRIPATFFMIGNSIKAYPTVAKEAFEIISDNPDLFSLGNHSSTHNDFYKLDNAQLGNELVVTHKLLQEHNVKEYTFFRAPYGNFLSRMADLYNNDNMFSTIASEYVGPVYWDIGGFYDKKFSKGAYWGDWSCWTKAWKAKVKAAGLDPIKVCNDGHYNEITKVANDPKRTSGIILLVHDFHISTVKMFIGSTVIAEDGSVESEDPKALLYRLKALQSEGYSFVPLDQNPEKIQELLEMPKI